MNKLRCEDNSREMSVISLATLICAAFVASPPEARLPGILRGTAQPRLVAHPLLVDGAGGAGEVPADGGATAAETTATSASSIATATAAPGEWSIADTVINTGIFLLLHTFIWSSAQFVGFSPSDVHDRWAFAIARLASIGAFAGLQQAAPGGISLSEWPIVPSPPPPGVTTPANSPQAANPITSNPAAAAVAFTLASLVASGLSAALLQGSVDASFAAELAWLPAPKPLDPSRALDLLVGAPIQEELFFRGFLLAALRRNGANELAALLVSALLFTVWHIDAIIGNAFLRGGDGGGLVQLFGLGVWLGSLYNGTGRKSLLLPIGTHSVYNGLILLLEAVRA